tara:strand:- start:588 stop:728 length:141 start_codon:yes stop_codon:yes gene_type:complete
MLQKLLVNTVMLTAVFCLTTALVFARDAIAGPTAELVSAPTGHSLR